MSNEHRPVDYSPFDVDRMGEAPGAKPDPITAGMHHELAMEHIAKMELQRQAVMQAPMTLRDAIETARNLRLYPETLIDGPRAKGIIDLLLTAVQSSRHFERALLAGEEVFVLRQSDRAAPDAINQWADQANTKDCRDDKVNDAYRTAARWRAQSLESTKWPD